MSRSAKELAAVADDARALGRDVTTTAVCDVTDTAAMQHAISGLVKLDILVNNAGTNIPEPFLEVVEEMPRYLACVDRACQRSWPLKLRRTEC